MNYKILFISILIFITIYYLFISKKKKKKQKNYNHESFANFKKLDQYDINKIYEFPNFLTDNECNTLIDLAKPKIEKSKVICEDGKNCIDNSYRTSSHSFINDSETEISNKINNKIKDLIDIHPENYEDLQVVRYFPKQEYKPHWDNCVGSKSRCKQFFDRGGARIATFLIYLNDDYKGGETHFPKRNIFIKPQKGKAALFFNLEDDHETTLDNSMHAGLPPKNGTKWLANKWIRTKKFKN